MSQDFDPNDPFLVYFNKKPKYFLSKSLFEKQGLESSALEELKELHVQKLTLFKAMEETDDVVNLKTYADAVSKIEFALQQAWGFELNEKYHEWYLIPKCTCPKMDNADRKGTIYGITSVDCPIHGC